MSRVHGGVQGGTWQWGEIEHSAGETRALAIASLAQDGKAMPSCPLEGWRIILTLPPEAIVPHLRGWSWWRKGCP